jgi:hypothetical protein
MLSASKSILVTLILPGQQIVWKHAQISHPPISLFWPLLYLQATYTEENLASQI